MGWERARRWEQDGDKAVSSDPTSDNPQRFAAAAFMKREVGSLTAECQIVFPQATSAAAAPPMNIHFAAASPLQSADPWPDYDAAQRRITGTLSSMERQMMELPAICFSLTLTTCFPI